MDRQYVGIDFHRRRSVIVRLDSAGERLAVTRIDNNTSALAAAMADAGDAPEVVIEATYGWYWAVDLLQELGATVHLANPKALNWGDRRVKNSVSDASYGRRSAPESPPQRSHAHSPLHGRGATGRKLEDALWDRHTCGRG